MPGFLIVDKIFRGVRIIHTMQTMIIILWVSFGTGQRDAAPPRPRKCGGGGMLGNTAQCSIFVGESFSSKETKYELAVLEPWVMKLGS